MNLVSLIRDRYDREARLAPALLSIFPAILAIFAWIPELRGLGSALLALLGLCGGTLWLAQLARDRGKMLEPALHASWGGKPSTAMLRHRDGRLSELVKERYKVQLGKLVPDLKFPTCTDEASAPEAADLVYEAAVTWLLASTRDKKKFGLIFEENINYGFRRNFWALKPIALFVAFSSFLGSMIPAVRGFFLNQTSPTPEVLIATGLIATYVLFIFLRVNSNWVLLVANAYAVQLLAACDMITQKPNKSKKSKEKRTI